MLKRKGYGILLSLLLLVLMVMTKEAVVLLKIKSGKFIKSWAIFTLLDYQKLPINLTNKMKSKTKFRYKLHRKLKKWRRHTELENWSKFHSLFQIPMLYKLLVIV